MDACIFGQKEVGYCVHNNRRNKGMGKNNYLNCFIWLYQTIVRSQSALMRWFKEALVLLLFPLTCCAWSAPLQKSKLLFTIPFQSIDKASRIFFLPWYIKYIYIFINYTKNRNILSSLLCPWIYSYFALGQA